VICYQSVRRGGLDDKIGNGENFRGVAQFTAEIALWPNCPHYQASPLTAQCGRQFSFRRSTINNDVARALQEGLQMQGLESKLQEVCVNYTWQRCYL
jgi:hypothetical protein